jgi:DNA-binding transcriptional LysR family regulator
MSMNEMRAIATFAKAVELGSLRKAAQAQGVSPQAASQSLAQLEEYLGVRLLNRTTRNISLTDEGKQFLESAQPALSALERALHKVRNAKDDIAGQLRIVGPRTTFLPVIAGLLDAFCKQHPDIQPDVHLDDRIGNWVEDRVDVGFRIGESLEDGVIARRLFPLQLIMCGTPGYIQKYGMLQSIEDLAAHRCSAFRHPTSGQVIPWFVKDGGEVVLRHISPALATNDAGLELDAVLSGEFIGQLANISVAEHIRSGRLVPMLVQHVTDHIGVFIYYGTRDDQSARARAFIDFSIEQLANSSAYVLSNKELVAAEAKGRKLSAH